MPIQVTCANCLKRFQVSDKFAGKTGACPNCKSTMTPKENQELTPEQQAKARLGEGFNVSIMVMMPVPFLLAAGFVGYVAWQIKKADAAMLAGAPVATGDDPAPDGSAPDGPAPDDAPHSD